MDKFKQTSNKSVFNLSTLILNEEEQLVLGLGLKYIPRVKYSEEDINNHITKAAKKLNRDIKLAIHFEDSEREQNKNIPKIDLPSKWDPPTSNKDKYIDAFTNNIITNINKQYECNTQKYSAIDVRIRDIILNLRRNNNITIKPADKNLGLVVLDTEDYISMNMVHLKDAHTYQVTGQDIQDIYRSSYEQLREILYLNGQLYVNRTNKGQPNPNPNPNHGNNNNPNPNPSHRNNNPNSNPNHRNNNNPNQNPNSGNYNNSNLNPNHGNNNNPNPNPNHRYNNNPNSNSKTVTNPNQNPNSGNYNNPSTTKGKNNDQELSPLAKSLLQLEDNEALRAAPFYCFPKLHKNKDPIPGRPIASAIGTATYHASKFIANKLTPLIPTLMGIVNSTDEFIMKLPKRINEGDIFMCADVASLYPSIPIIEGVRRTYQVITQLGWFIDKEARLLCDILLWILNNSYVQFDNTTYKQIKGTAMGTPAAPIYANIVLYSVEMSIPGRSEIPFFARYLDDIFAIVNPKYGEEFVERYNNSIEGLKLEAITMDRTGVFLDVQVSLDKDDKIEYELYQKSINRYQFLHPFSSHPQHVKDSWVTNEVIRSKRRCSSETTFQAAKARFITRLTSRGYTMDNIEKLTNATYVDSRIRKLEEKKGHTLDFDYKNKVFNIIVSLPDTRRRVDWRKILRIPHNIINRERESMLDYIRKVRLVTRNNPNIQKSLTRSIFKGKDTKNTMDGNLNLESLTIS